MADHYFVFNGYSLADKGMALDLAAFADKGIFLHFYKGTYFRFIIYAAAV